MMRTIEVELGDRSYPISIGEGLVDKVRDTVESIQQAGRPVALVYDGNLENAQPGFLKGAFEGIPKMSLPPGEPSKSMEQLGAVYNFLADVPLDRTGVLLVLGGGVAGDLGGFAAASFLRGIEFHLIPTTLLSMVDSSVGGKTGINLRAGKNLVGAFYQPVGVTIDIELLQSLPVREFRAGMAEVIKYGMLGDRELFELLEAETPLEPTHPALPEVIERCCRQKVQVVQADEQESAASGGRALLNLGHTFAHAIESVAGYGTYLHGEAVAVGLVLAARYSEKLGRLSGDDVHRVEALIARYELPVQLVSPLDVSTLMAAMLRDKKVRFGKLRLVAMEALGRAVTVEKATEDDVIKELWATVRPND